MPKYDLISAFENEDQQRLGTAPGPKELSLKPSKDLIGAFNNTDLYRDMARNNVVIRDRENAGTVKTAGRALIRGGLNTMSAIGGAINLAGDALKRGGAETVGEELSFIGENTSDYYRGILQEHKEWQRPEKFSHEGFFENFLENPLSFSMMVLAENTPMMLSMLVPAGAVGVGARAIGGSARVINAARIAAGSAGIGGLEAGASYDELIQEGVDPRDAMGTAVNVGIINGALESLPLSILFRNPAGRKIKSRLAQLILAESGTEGLQTFNENLQKRAYHNPDQSLGEGILESMYAAAMIAPILGWAGGDLQKADRRNQAVTPEQQAINDRIRRDVQKTIESGMSLDEINEYEEYSPNAPDGNLEFQKNLLTGAELAKRGIQTSEEVQSGYDFMRRTGMDFDIPINEADQKTSIRRPFYQAVKDVGQPETLKARIEGSKIYPSKVLAEFDLSVQENKGDVPKGQLKAEERADGWQIVPAVIAEPQMMEPKAVPQIEDTSIKPGETPYADRYEKYISTLPEEQKEAGRESIRAVLDESKRTGTSVRPDMVTGFIDEMLNSTPEPPPEVAQAEEQAPDEVSPPPTPASAPPAKKPTKDELYEQMVEKYGKERADEALLASDNIGKMQKTSKDVTPLEDLPPDEHSEIQSFLDDYGDSNDAVKMRFDGKGTDKNGLYSFTPYGEEFDGDSFAVRGKPTYEKIKAEYEATAKRFGKKPWKPEGETKDEGFNARTLTEEGTTELRPVKGARFHDEGTQTDLIVHRKHDPDTDDYTSDKWTISEAKTGLSITGGMWWPSEAKATKYLQDTILGDREAVGSIEQIAEQVEKFLEDEQTTKVEKPDPRDELLAQRNRGEAVGPREEKTGKPEKSVKPEKPKKTPSKEVEKPEIGKKGPLLLGKNTEGVDIYEDAEGVRSYYEGSFTITEPVTLVPGRGMEKPTVESRYKALRTEYLLPEEIEAMEGDVVGEGPTVTEETDADAMIKSRDEINKYISGLEAKLKNNKQLSLKSKKAVNDQIADYLDRREKLETAIDKETAKVQEAEVKQAPPRDQVELNDEWKGVDVEIPIERENGETAFITRDGYEAVDFLNKEISLYDQILDCLSG